ncbi:CDP-alcohol phosphatidyltransferase family protein [Bacteroides sp. 519]|uniref:CDP-alcohol phosphatidyltransferase family protein n=1 Tax=Bacteroides sp. 519 TaxID=2302937 RepID=UPI0013D7373C|nr:CDP-alcohol phosphatidyltransferase family protein [Bacteroides sp. 519]NDV60275.1 CDP-alcohol phosphatidyltransferase family protein [Bacteroides sp. 519]
MKLRDLGQQFIYKIIDPFIKGMIKIGITPNFITTTGLVLNIVAAAVFMVGGYHGERGDFSYVGWGGFIILFAGLFDMIDGRLARVGNMSSTYGALYDSVLDRYSELITLFGICYYLILQGYFLSSMFAFVALIGSMMVSYVRARAEGLGIECKVGFMQRPERVILTGAGAMLCGIFYYFAGNVEITVDFLPFPVFETVAIFVIPIVIVAIFSNITAISRLIHCKKALD